MARYSTTLRDQNLAPIDGAYVSVTNTWTNEPATLTDDAAQPLDNPFVTGEYGEVTFNTAAGSYKISYNYGGRTVLTEVTPVGTLILNVQPDPAHAGEYIALDADGNATYSVGTGADLGLRTDLAASTGAALSGYDLTLTGTQARSVADRLKDVVSIMDFLPANIRAQVRARTQTVNLAPYMTLAFAAAWSVYFPAGSYWLEHFVIPADRSIITDDFATEFVQLDTTAPGVDGRMLNISGSNTFIGNCRVRGNIATQTGEQHHMIFANAGTYGGDITNTRIGDIVGQDVRGDVVYIGADAGFEHSGVKIGTIFGDNIYRNVVAFCGCDDFSLTAVSGTRVGYAVLDIEPEPSNAPVTNGRIGSVKGGVFQCAPANPSSPAESISIEHLDLNPAYQANSSPAYALHDVGTAIVTRNSTDIYIGKATINGHVNYALSQTYNPGELDNQSIEFGWLDVSNVGASESMQLAYIIVSKMRVTISGGNVDMSATNKFLFRGNPSTPLITPCEVNNIVTNGSIAHFTSKAAFSDITFTGSADVPLFKDVADGAINRLSGTFGRLGTDTTNMTVDNTTFVKAGGGSGVFTGTATGNRIRNSTLDGVAYGDRIFGDTTATGWGVPTGTATKTTFDTTSVTLPQLAERVKALIDNMAAEGRTTS